MNDSEENCDCNVPQMEGDGVHAPDCAVFTPVLSNSRLPHEDGVEHMTIHNLKPGMSLVRITYGRLGGPSSIENYTVAKVMKSRVVLKKISGGIEYPISVERETGRVRDFLVGTGDFYTNRWHLFTTNHPSISKERREITFQRTKVQMRNALEKASKYPDTLSNLEDAQQALTAYLEALKERQAEETE